MEFFSAIKKNKIGAAMMTHWEKVPDFKLPSQSQICGTHMSEGENSHRLSSSSHMCAVACPLPPK